MSNPFTNASILDSGLSTYVPDVFPITQVLKTPKQGCKSDSDNSTKVTRSPNWGDSDSLLLIQAVCFINENPICIVYQHNVLTLVDKCKAVKDL